MASNGIHHDAIETDVAIIGAGPVGMTLALLLRKQGIDVAIFDRQPARYVLPRACSLDHETQRTWYSVDLRKRLHPLLQTAIEGDLTWRDKNAKILAEVEWLKIGKSGYSVMAGFHQPTLEAALEEAVLESGTRVYRGGELAGFEQDKNGVTAHFKAFTRTNRTTTVKGDRYTPEPGQPHGETLSATGVPPNVTSTPTTPNGSTPIVNGAHPPAKGASSSPNAKGWVETVRAKYLVGADGANSLVRRLLQIPVHDLGFEYDWLIIDLLIKGALPKVATENFPAQWCTPERPTTMVFSGPGRRRIETMRLPTETNEEIMRPAKVKEICTRWGYTDENTTLERAVVYTFRANWAEDWQKGRVFLAGDACHLTPPFIAQGMNSGVRDANTLAWRLALVLKGQSDPSILDSYGPERIPHVAALIEAAVELGTILCIIDEDEATRVHAELVANGVKRPPEPHLGPGVLYDDRPQVGRLGVQTDIRANGVEGLTDEVVGSGWFLLVDGLAKGTEAIDLLSDEAKATWRLLGGKTLDVAEPGHDLKGAYREWFTSSLEGAKAVLVRPDYYVYGYVDTLEKADAMVLKLAKDLQLRPSS